VPNAKGERVSYVKKILEIDEQILYRAPVHWSVYLPSLGLLILGAGLIGWFVPIYQNGGRDVVAGIFAILGLVAVVASPYYLLKAFIERRTTELVVTNRRVIAKTGLIRRKTWEINAAKVEGVEVEQGILGRILGYGTVHVKGTGGGIAPVRKIDKPVVFRRHVTAL